MKKSFLKISLLACLGLTTLGGFTACSDDDNNGGGGSTEKTDVMKADLEAAAQQYINATIYPTYRQLADSTSQLFDQLHAIKIKLQNAPATLTDADIEKACDIFLKARANYETSEAFLFGAASDFGIDPHIDTWPLDLQGLAEALNNTTQIAAMDAYEEGHEGDADYFTGDVYANGKLGPELLGFHGIEFIIFRNGAPRSADDLRGVDTYQGTELAGQYSVNGLDEIIFATAVAGDLRNCCWRMEVSWNPDAPADHRTKVEDDLEWQTTVTGNDLSYGENFLLAGQAGSTYATVRRAIDAILVAGCANISEEVGVTKMGKPNRGEDPNYIESPYSHKSLVDFYDNIMSIENSYMGGRPELRDESKSIHNCLAQHNPELDTKVVAAINNAKAKIMACPAPFVLNYSDPAVTEAINACDELTTALNEASAWILRN